MRNFFLIIVCFFILFQIRAQNPKTIGAIDTLTYQQFFSNDYKGLQKTAKQAIKEGIDFYFLRTRLAISYYNQKNYESALPHFKKAQEWFPLDTIIQEYYYYTLQFTGRHEDAYDLAKQFSKSMQQKVGFQKIRVFQPNQDEISLTIGIAGNNNIARFDSLDIKDTNIYAEGTFQGGTTLASFVLKKRITPRSNLTIGYSYFENRSFGKIQTYDSTAVQTFWNHPYQLNMAFDYLFPIGLKVGGSYGAYQEASNYLSADYDTTTYTFNYNHNAKVNNRYTASLFLTYRWNRFEFYGSGSIGDLASKKQKQVELGLVYFPFGNQVFYSVTTGTLLFNDSTKAFLIHQKLGGYIYKNLWYELSGSYGNFQNYIGAGGFSTYNTFDPIQFLSNISFIFYFKNLTIIPSYGFQIRKSNYYTVDKSLHVNTLKNTYYHHILTLTAKWTF